MSIGQAVGGVIGGVIGFFVGGPAGAFQGAMLGASIGGGFTPGSLPTVEGPRLQDLRPQASEYGRPIAIVYGTAGISGNVIEAFDLVEVETETEQGGGFSEPSQVSRTFAYYADFAVLVCEGEIDGVLRIWAGPDERLIYDGFALEGSGTIRIYTGTETQLPDPMLESYHGVGNVPAYRGSAYVVFEQFPVAKDGNMIPFLKFEVSKSGHTCGDNFTEIDIGPSNARLYDPAPEYLNTFSGSILGRPEQDPDTGIFYYLVRTHADTLHLDKVDPDTGAVDTIVFGSAPWSYSRMAMDPVAKEIIVINGAIFYRVDLVTFTLVTGSEDHGFFDHLKSDVLYSTIKKDYLFLNYKHETIEGGLAHPDNWGREGVFFGGYFVDCDGVAAVVSLTQDTTFDLQGTDPSMAPGARQAAAIGLGVPVQWDVFDPVSRRLICLHNFLNDGKSEYFNIDTGEHVSCFDPPFPAVANATYNKYIGRIFCTDGSDMYMINPAAIVEEGVPIECTIFGGLQLYSDDPADIVKGHFSLIPTVMHTDRSKMAFFDRFPGSAPSGDNFMFTVRPNAGGMGLWEIVADLSDRAGQTAYDVSELVDIVPGYVIARQTTARAAIDALRPAYNFDAVASGGLVKFVKRGGDIVAVISDDDLGAHLHGDQAPEPLMTTRQMDVELPRTVNVNYLCAATDYATATRTSSRLIGNSGQEVTMDFPLVLSDTKAQEIAVTNLYVSWLQRLTYAFTLPRRYSYLEPTDVIEVKGHTMRIGKITATARGLLQCEAVEDDAEHYSPNVIVTETQPIDKTVYIPGATRLELM